MSKHKLNIVHFAAECAPYAKSGGLGEVVAALPKAQAQKGHKITVILPLHSSVKKLQLPLKCLIQKQIAVKGRKYTCCLKQLANGQGVTTLFLGNEKLFGNRSRLYSYPDDGLRFLVFNLASLQLINELAQLPAGGLGKIDVIHCHDWHAALVPQLLALDQTCLNLRKTATVFTIHNLAYQGPSDWWRTPSPKQDSGAGNPAKAKYLNYLNFTRRGIMQADIINTVSERYAAEILTPEFGQGLDNLLRSKQTHVFGIINGVDYAVHNPKFDPNVYAPFDTQSFKRKQENKLKLQKEMRLEVSPDMPLIGMVNRLTEQKGFELMMSIIPQLIKLQLQLAVVGSGDREYINFFSAFARKHPKKVAVSSPFTENMASKVFAGSDMYLMPSRFEPCGISQLISLRYGSLPIVHKTGGLHDTISNYEPATGRGNGFVFSAYSKEDLLIALVRALETYQYKNIWQTLAVRGMEQSFSWDLPADKYIKLYRMAVRHRAERIP